MNVNHVVSCIYMDVVRGAIKFEWDKGNTNKNWQRHGVSTEEAEQAFFDEYKITSDDIVHSKTEKRSILLGKTKEERLLYIVYTVRNGKIRIISVRDTNKKEEKIYEKAT